MTTKLSYPILPAIAEKAWVNSQQYHQMYQESIQNPEAFWAKQGQRIDWFKPYTKVCNQSFAQDNVSIRWYEDGQLNACYNCIDRHLPEKAYNKAIIWEADAPGRNTSLTYQQLYHQVCRCANALKGLGVEKGDVVAIYLPMIAEAAIAMLACARIGAVHSVIFGGFSAEAVAGRLLDSKSKVIITADEGLRGGKSVPLKQNVEEALSHPEINCVEAVIMVPHTHAAVAWHNHDYNWHQLLAEQSDTCEPEPMNAEDPLFILYTSGSTGQPKGVLHTTGGYMVYASLTHKYVFDYKPNEIYWCCADVGWITGHSYMIYGPLANAATTLLFEGVPTYPSITRLAEIIDQHKVNLLYTAPTLVRSLMAHGKEAVEGASLDSLRILASVGEPINPEAWGWYHKNIGKSQCPIMDTWWQTETGGILITPLPGATTLKPGSASLPFFGIQPALLDANGLTVEGEGEGSLVILNSWPGQSRTLFNAHERFVETYFSTFPGTYFTGDGARRDADGYYWITGRVDDVINVSGHRMGTAEIESALVAHQQVSEAAIVSVPHNIKGQSIYAYVTLNNEIEPSEALRHELRQWVRREIGAIANIETLQWAAELPKTRSGKIMRRILRKIANCDYGSLGDTSTLANPTAVDELILERKKIQKAT